VAAETKDAAEQAARLVEVDYDDLPLVTLDNALSDDAPILHPDVDSYTYLGPKRPQTAHPNIHGYALIDKSETGATLEEVFARADHVFEHTFVTAREFQGFLEPRACVVWIDEQERVRISNWPRRSAYPSRRSWSTRASSAAISAARGCPSTNSRVTSWRAPPVGQSRQS
jgi:CO/xanthine dehydrogenase Mo-binding subunit